jgi:DNA primase
VQKYSRDIVTQVLAAIDIVDIIGASLELRNAGAGRMKALCPFHHEKTPSFTVNRNRQTFHCFGCGKGGDAIRFLMDHEGLSFIEALRKLADRASVRLPALTERDNREEFLRGRLLELGKFAARRFREILEDPLRGSLGRQYLKTRALKEEIVRRFGLGYVPEGWSTLLDAAKERGFQESVLEASGLFKRGERGGFYDFFRNRLIFPIRDLSGNVVAFGGRDLGDSPAKYINSPETVVYRKSRVLYGLYEAREALRREKYAIFVEGYFDLLRCFDAGIENVVASCGTALTKEQAVLLHRYVSEVVLVYDGDAAGIQAAIKGTGVLAAAGLTVRALALPENQDPDDFIRAEGRDAFMSLVQEAPDFVTFYTRMSAPRAGTIEGRAEIAQEIFAILVTLDDELRIDEYLKRTALELGLNDWVCRREFDRFRREDKPGQTPHASVPETPAPLVNSHDCEFVAILLSDEALLQKARTLLEGVCMAPGPLAEVLESLFQNTHIEVNSDLNSEEARALYTAAAASDPPAPKIQEDLVLKRINRLEKEALGREAQQVQEAIQEAEQTQDTTRAMELLARKVRLIQQMEKLGIS